MELSESDFTAFTVKKTPFNIDLNEAPLSSPPRNDVAVAAPPVPAPAPAGKGKAVAIDINAFPSENEGEESHQFVNYGIHTMRGASFYGNSKNGPVTCSAMLSVGNGNRFDITGATSNGVTFIKPVPVDNVQLSSSFYRNVKEADSHSLFRGRSDYSVNMISFQNQGQEYLEKLRRFVFNNNGRLEDGWHVEFVYCQIRCNTCAVYCSPDGNKFESMIDVARYLGLVSNCHSLGSQDINHGLSLAPNWSQSYGRKTESSVSRMNDFNGCQGNLESSSPVKISLGIENKNVETCKLRSDVTVAEAGSEATANNDSSRYKDVFPVQFDDFFVLSLGELDLRPAYHCSNRIWPVGYKSSWHDKITGSLFVCDVSDGGDCGPVFRVQRYPCTARSIPIGVTVLSRPSTSTENKKSESTVGTSSEEDTNIQMMLSYHSPPNMDSVSTGVTAVDEVSNSDSVSKDLVKPACDSSQLDDGFGEFLVEGRSSSSVWRMMSEKLVHFCREMYKKNGLCKFCCKHSYLWCSSCILYDNNGTTAPTDSLTKFCHMSAPFDISRGIESDGELYSTCEALDKWLGQDRFGLDVDFVQELIERLPGVHSFSDYTVLKNRTNKSESQTVENGFLLAKRTRDAQDEKETNCKTPKKKKSLFPPGKQLGSKLPTALVGDVLESWELLWRFSEVLGLEQTLSFEELEEELVDSDSFNLRSTYASSVCGTKRDVSTSTEMQTLEEVTIARQASTNSGFMSETLYKIHCSLLKVLLEDLRSKVDTFAESILESGVSTSKTSKNNFIFSGKSMFDLLPVNELTWPELVRRYFLVFSSMDGGFDFPEITGRESCKVFHCLQGDAGALHGPLPGVALLEADALLLAEAMKQIFGASNSIYENMNVELNVFVAISSNNEVKEMNDADVPKWAQVLEPVRRLPTNVGARIRRCIYEALELDPPEWAVKLLQHSISKEVYKGNASGPTKRAVLSVLNEVCGETQQPKPIKRRKYKQSSTLSDVIMRQCRKVLRCAAANEEGKVFYNLTGRTLLNTCDNDDGLLGFAAMVSRPLDFRTIDLRLVFGTYGGSHEAFLEDVREVWNHIRTANADQTHLVNLAETLSQKFEMLYENEVLTLVQQLKEYTSAECLNPETKKDMEDLLEHLSEIPKAPWDEVCKVCGVDKEDDSVLLCDKCNSGYHLYCLDPPLAKIPEENWYCPSCITRHSTTLAAASQNFDYNDEFRGRKCLGEFTRGIMDSLARLITTMEVKDYWEYSVEERIFLFKYLGDGVLNSSSIHEHLEQCASASIDLQQKLGSLSTEWRNLKLREEVGEKMANENTSVLNNGAGKSGIGQPLNKPVVIDLESDTEESIVIEDKISVLQDSIAWVELELQKVSLKKECLGEDSSGRLYWIFSRPGSTPWVLVDTKSNKDHLQFYFNKPIPTASELSIQVSYQIYFYRSNSEIEELIHWLMDNDSEQNELIDSLLRCLIYGRNSSNRSASNFQEINQPTSVPITGKNNTKPNELKTRALMTLEKNYGLCSEPVVSTISVKWMNAAVSFGGRMSRCKCLEPIWPSRHHCFSCHRSLSTRREIDEHKDGKCIFYAHNSRVTDGVSKGKGIQRASTDKTRKFKFDNAGQEIDYRSVGCSNDMTSPYKLEDISGKFFTKSSNKDLVKEIGLLGSNGVPSWVPSPSPYLNDPTLNLTTPPKGEVANQTDQSVTGDNWSQKAAGKNIIPGKRRVKRSNSSKNYTALDVFKELEEIGRLSAESWLKSSFSRPGNDVSVIHDYSSKPLVGQGAHFLRQLKISLLDMEAALPEGAVKPSTANSEKRCTWRSFVKSAKSIFEMVQATIVLEYMIKTEFLRNEWWYWSSISAAGKIATISSLALKIYTLDAAIIYETPLQ